MKNSACAKLLLLAGSGLCFVSSVSAADWHFDPRLSLTGIYDDNRFLETDAARKKAVNGAQLDASASFAGIWPRDTLRFVPHVWTHNYPGDSDQNETNGELSFFYDHAGLTTKTLVRANYSQRSLLKSVLPGTDINEGLGESSRDTNARLSLDGEQRYFYVDPSFEWTVNTRNKLRVSGEYQSRTYDERSGSEYVDNTGQSASLGWSYDLSRRSSLSLTGTAARYSPDVGDDTNVFGVRADWSRRVTEISRYYFRLGASRAEAGSGSTQRSDTAVSAGAGVNWAFVVTGVFLDLTRNVVPNLAGVAVTQDEARFRVERQFRPRVSGFFSLVGVKDGNIYSDNVFGPRTYAAGQLGFEWRVRRAFTLVGAYGYSWQEYDDGSGSASSNSVNLSIVYEPKRPEWISGVFR